MGQILERLKAFGEFEVYEFECLSNFTCSLDQLLVLLLFLDLAHDTVC